MELNFDHNAVVEFIVNIDSERCEPHPAPNILNGDRPEMEPDIIQEKCISCKGCKGCKGFLSSKKKYSVCRVPFVDVCA